jgi:hypothetical protein
VPTLYRDTGYSLIHLIEDIKVGRLPLPDIQRPFVWSSSKARDLFDSMYRGYPVGTLMFWETGAEVGVRQIGAAKLDKAPQLLIVDGQQRLTSLFAVLTGTEILTKTFDRKRIRLAFRPEDESFEVTDAAIERNPEFVPDITALWANGYKTTVRNFLQRLGASRDDELTDTHQDLLEERIDRVRDLRDFRFQIVELSAIADEEQVAEIFVRINSEGVNLNQADFILTLMSVHWEKGRRQLEDFSRAAVDAKVTGASPKNAFLDPSPDQLLRVGVALAFRRARLQHVYNLLRGKDLETGNVSAERRDAQFGRLAAAQEKVLDLTNWHEFLKCLQSSGFRSRKMITSENAVLYTYAMWLIGRNDFGLGLNELRPALSRWFFMAQTTGRYTSSPESQLESDLNRISFLTPGDATGFIAELDRIVQANFTPDYWDITLPNRLDTSAPRSPALFAYLAALNLLDAEALFSDVRVRSLLDPTISPPRAIERHHLFPKRYLASLGVTAIQQVNAIANMAFLDWAENSDISADAPSRYWPVMSQAVTQERLRVQVGHHALPVGWEQLEYHEFLEKRRTLIARVVREGFSTLWPDHQPKAKLTVQDLIEAGESQTIEFKSTARYNMHTKTADPKLEHVIVKTVCGFLNADGGTLLIGVADDGTILGLDHDLSTLGGKPNLDGYELALRQLLETSLSVPTAATVRISFERADSHSVCVVAVASAGKPVFAKPPRGSGSEVSEFWVRTGNQTRQLHGEDMVLYHRDHWG